MKYCSVGTCNSQNVKGKTRKESVFLHSFPNPETQQQRWLIWKNFVSTTRQGFKPSRTSYICSRHFKDSDYQNASEYDFYLGTLGIEASSCKLLLSKTAFPTIKDNPGLPPKAVSSSAIRRKHRTMLREQQNFLSSVYNLMPLLHMDGDADDDEDKREAYDEEINDMVEEDMTNDPVWSPLNGDDDCDDENALDRTAVDDGWLNPAGISHLWNSSDELSGQKKFVVAGAQLLKLLLYCQKCTSRKVDVHVKSYGAVSKFNLRCECNNVWEWQTAGESKQDTVVMNALFTGATLFTGSQPCKVNEYMEANNIQFPSIRTFFRYQKKYLCQVVQKLWLRARGEAVSETKKCPRVTVGGDARCDCMGFCAQFGTYTVMDLTTNKIIDIQPVSRVETQMSSPAMEKEGLIRCLKALDEEGVVVDVLVTDQHLSIAKMMREEIPSIRHYYDAWHVVKGIRKKLMPITKEKVVPGEENLEPFTTARVDSICNRLYYMARHTVADITYSEIMEEKRVAMLNHIVGVCQHPQNRFYRACGHGDKKKERLDPEGTSFLKIKKILSASSRAKAIANMSPYGQTSRLESFHRMILSFAPKHLSFGYQGMTARIHLAALKYNENCDRPLILDEEGKEKLRVEFLKYKGGKGKARTVRPERTNKYLIDLMQETENVARGKVDDLPLLSVNPPSMTSQMETEQRLAVTTRYRSRFAKSLELAVPEPLSQSTPSVSESLPVVRNVTTTPRRGKRTSPGQSLSKSKRKLNPN